MRYRGGDTHAGGRKRTALRVATALLALLLAPTPLHGPGVPRGCVTFAPLPSGGDDAPVLQSSMREGCTLVLAYGTYLLGAPVEIPASATVRGSLQ